jgi:hypothetical protein
MGSRRSRKGIRRCARCGATHKRDDLLELELQAENPNLETRNGFRRYADVCFLFAPKCMKSLPVEAALKYEYPIPENKHLRSWARRKSSNHFTFYHPLTGEKRLVNVVTVVRASDQIIRELDLEAKRAESTT